MDHDSQEAVELRKGQGDPLIMYLIVRESLGMSPGKIAAQCAHASQMVLLKFIKDGGHLTPYYSSFDGGEGTERPKYELGRNDEGKVIAMPLSPETTAKYDREERTQKWLASSFRKVVLNADDAEWTKVLACPGITYVKVTDAGLTEIAAGSDTVLGVYPMYKSEVPKAIKRLQVLK